MDKWEKSFKMCNATVQTYPLLAFMFFSPYFLLLCVHGHTLLYCASHYCALEILYFCKVKVCGNPKLNMSFGTIFPKAFAYFVSLGHMLVIFTML